MIDCNESRNNLEESISSSKETFYLRLSVKLSGQFASAKS